MTTIDSLVGGKEHIDRPLTARGVVLSPAPSSAAQTLRVALRSYSLTSYYEVPGGQWSAPGGLPGVGDLVLLVFDDEGDTWVVAGGGGASSPEVNVSTGGPAPRVGQLLWVDTDESSPGNIPDNSIATAKLQDGAVTSAKIADNTIAIADLATALKNLVTTPTGQGVYMRFFNSVVNVGGTGWQTVSFPFGFTVAAGPHVVLGTPQPASNGAALTGWSLAFWNTNSVSLFLANAATQNITFYGVVIAS